MAASSSEAEAADRPARARRFPWLRVLLGLAVLALCALLARRLDLHRLTTSLHEADWRLVALAALVNLTVNSVARIGRWQALLARLTRSGTGARFAELAALYFASQATSNLLPARAGEALRVVQLHRRHGYLVSALITVQLVEILVGAVTLGAVTLPMVALAGAPRLFSVAILSFALAGPVGMLLLLGLARLAPKPALPAAGGRRAAFARDALDRVVDAMRRIHSPGVWARSLGWSLLSDLSDVAMIGLVLAAVGVPLPPASWVVLYAAINLVLILPSVPAQLGVLELGAVAALRALGVDEHAALAFALLYHAAHLLPPTLVGAVLLVRLVSATALNQAGREHLVDRPRDLLRAADDLVVAVLGLVHDVLQKGSALQRRWRARSTAAGAAITVRLARWSGAERSPAATGGARG